MNKWFLAIATGVAMAFSISGAWAQQVKATGYFRVEKVDGIWWLIDPEGNPFISTGVTTVQMDSGKIQNTNHSPMNETFLRVYGTADHWRKATAERLIGWGFNTLGAWSDQKICDIQVSGKSLCYAPNVDFAAAYGRSQGKNTWLHADFPDIFADDFETFSHQHAIKTCAPYKNDRWVLGWFSDNELRWGPDWRTSDEILTSFLEFPSTSPGRKIANDMLKKHYKTIEDFNAAWKTSFASWAEMEKTVKIPQPVKRKAIYSQNTAEERIANEKDPARAAFVRDCDEFLKLVSERYFSVTTSATKKADPNHMTFGARFAYVPPAPVIAAVGKYVDVISFNCYDYGSDPARTIKAYSVMNKPMIIGEFSYKGKDSGLPNTRGAGVVKETQSDRAEAFARYVREGLSFPWLVGYHWFQFADQPKEGRFDGENSNFGLINVDNVPYEPMVRKMKEINESAIEIHRKAAK